MLEERIATHHMGSPSLYLLLLLDYGTAVAAPRSHAITTAAALDVVFLADIRTSETLQAESPPSA